VVFSGGEPALNPALGSIIRYYAPYVRDRVVITNGLLMDRSRRADLLSAGATAFTFSVDTIDPARFMANRGLPSTSLARILENLRDAARDRHFGLGINAVVTSATTSVESVSGLLSIAEALGLDFVKFQPVFDDGYVGRNAPGLRLGPSDAEALDEISKLLERGGSVPTNVAGFWRDLAALVRGKRLPGTACGLGDTTALLVEDRLVRCYWVPSADISVTRHARESDASRSVRALQIAKPSCAVDARCFCMQSLEHEWS
jgi:MoaA/NifB/PqqE/SkfB family radical SAM enzyme